MKITEAKNGDIIISHLIRSQDVVTKDLVSRLFSIIDFDTAQGKTQSGQAILQILKGDLIYAEHHNTEAAVFLSSARKILDKMINQPTTQP